MKNCGTCGAPVADAVEKCFKCGSPIQPAKDGPKLMQKFTKGKTVKRVRGKPLRKRPLKAAHKRKATAEERQLKKLASGDEGAVAARILRELIDEGAIGKTKAASAEKLVGKLGAALPPSQPKPEPAAEPAPEAADPKLARLKELGALRDSGILTKAEFATLKQQIISRE
ncbi:MAG: SHOCT domain-containing protein [Candidatus Poseidoniia archaeon]|jgi:hypothetical protein|nr:hypothetical protein [Euryarchaeota archaeon]MDP6274737.1 SHOCT domain-containing protein [Candidatus Poseidoniia archaeon]MEE1544786.1 SHOCT domain-containing protein [Alphaproteobacteria bacterium]MDP7136079.1 SHOCT domain-containing protein [Candidatus Poseidoniia archaeon]MDP7242897.1 SHOCT domain-containing protein [Candidatus Poseidoniia archaeon]|tara:strand:- start:737 stop:1246 length:510 start_codon:yes stop_codon:yes gene_type:complete